MTNAILVLKPSNSKLGNVAATYSSIESSCPTDCSLKDNGCYAQMGFVGIHTSKLNKKKATPKQVASEEAKLIKKAIKEEKNTKPLRIHVAGDCRTNEAAKMVSNATKEWGHKVWSYTHAWKTVARSSWGTVSVLASVDNVNELKLARRKGYAPAIVVRNFLSKKAYEFHGFKLIPCPNQTHENITCEKCKLCWNDKKLKSLNAVIGFEAHGAKRKSLPVIK